MGSADERYVMVYNGEIYNFHSLREELEQVGKRFRTQSDTEVLLEAYGYWGATCLSKFHGMFALAVYDTMENELFLARDRTGIKPLYYATLDGAFCFASEIKALQAERSVAYVELCLPRRFSPAQLYRSAAHVLLGNP